MAIAAMSYVPVIGSFNSHQPLASKRACPLCEPVENVSDRLVGELLAIDPFACPVEISPVPKFGSEAAVVAALRLGDRVGTVPDPLVYVLPSADRRGFVVVLAVADEAERAQVALVARLEGRGLVGRLDRSEPAQRFEEGDARNSVPLPEIFA